MDQHKLKALIDSARNKDATFVIKNARVVNVFTREVMHNDVAMYEDTIIGVGQYSAKHELDAKGAYLCPGLMDAHVHIESTMAHPLSFARTLLKKGTTTVIADPHEMANVSGAPGIQYLLDQTEGLPLTVYMMVPSCVPCTPFENSGAVLKADDLVPFLSHPRVLGLGEVMDYVSVTTGAPDMLDKLAAFSGYPMDGHAPLVTGDKLNAYCCAGPATDHECSDYDEVLEKLRAGMRVMLRMGSAAHGIDAIFRRIAWEELPTDNLLLCTDDRHLEDTRRDGHINFILRRAVACGINPIDAVCMATINTARAFGLNRQGGIAPGYKADLVLFEDLREFKPLGVITGGRLYDDSLLATSAPPMAAAENSVHLKPRTPGCLDLIVTKSVPVIELVPKQLVTKLSWREVPVDAQGRFQPGWGLLKLAVLERHHATGSIGLGVLSGLGIQNGAIASTVGHDSHNLIVAGDNDRDMLLAIDALEDCGGGYVVAGGGEIKALMPLPIAGLMTDRPLEEILSSQRALSEAAAALGASQESDPFILLSFLALPVIPHVRLTNLGVFDVANATFIL